MYMEWGCEAINIALERSKIEMNLRLEVLGGTSSDTWRHMVANSSEVGVRIGEAGAKLAASCDQDEPRYL